jgi:SAM-dependent methyltransferase
MTEPTSPRAFDEFAPDYEKLLDDPLRNRFTGGNEYFIELKCRALLRLLSEVRPARRRLRVLDTGCGKGAAFRFLDQDLEVFGSDVSRAMLQKAVRLRPVTLQEPFDLPFANDTFDAAFAFCVYHHIDPRKHGQHLRDLVRVTRPGGRVIIFEHNPFNPVTQAVFRRAPIDAGCHMITPSALRALFNETGLADVRTGYLLFVPQALAKPLGFLESALAWLPVGAQYFVSGTKRSIGRSSS